MSEHRDWLDGRLLVAWLQRQLLRELEVGPACEQGLDQRVEGLSFFASDVDQVRVERGEDADLGLAAGFRHAQDSSASATMWVQTKRGGRATNTPPPAKETELPMQAQSTPVHVPSDVVAYFRAGGRIVRTIYCNQHGRTTSIVPFGGGCVVCEFERRNRGAGS